MVEGKTYFEARSVLEKRITRMNEHFFYAVLGVYMTKAAITLAELVGILSIDEIFLYILLFSLFVETSITLFGINMRLPPFKRESTETPLAPDSSNAIRGARVSWSGYVKTVMDVSTAEISLCFSSAPSWSGPSFRVTIPTHLTSKAVALRINDFVRVKGTIVFSDGYDLIIHAEFLESPPPALFPAPSLP